MVTAVVALAVAVALLAAGEVRLSRRLAVARRDASNADIAVRALLALLRTGGVIGHTDSCERQRRTR